MNDALEAPAPGSIALVELHAARPEATIGFHEAVGGWSFEVMGATRTPSLLPDVRYPDGVFPTGCPAAAAPAVGG